MPFIEPVDKQRLDSIKASIAASPPTVRALLKVWINQNYEYDGTLFTESAEQLFYFLGPDENEFSPEQREFLNAISGDDLTAILKGQIYIERLMEWMIAREMDKASVMFDGWLSYDDKIDLLKMLKIDIRVELITRLKRIAEVRNKFGHRIEKMYFDMDDAILLDYKLLPTDKIWLDGIMKQHYPNDAGHGDRVRLLLFVTWIELVGRRLEIYGPMYENEPSPEDMGSY